jgi:hypothetical protein
MARGRPVKKPQSTLNISGLHNQSRQSSPFSESTLQPTPPRSQAPSPKGVSWTQASLENAWQWHKGQGNWFAQRVQVLARHYQIFEALLIMKHSGSRNSRSWLYDEQVKTWTWDWLTSQKTGDITPRQLQSALNGTIFPELNINLANRISERTACWWLIKLGWHWTVVQKGVYMDGHDRDNVVEYWNKVFLPAIAKGVAWLKFCTRGRGEGVWRTLTEIFSHV